MFPRGSRNEGLPTCLSPSPRYCFLFYRKIQEEFTNIRKSCTFSGTEIGDYTHYIARPTGENDLHDAGGRLHPHVRGDEPGGEGSGNG